jgi:hypothetical protein
MAYRYVILLPASSPLQCAFFAKGKDLQKVKKYGNTDITIDFYAQGAKRF